MANWGHTWHVPRCPSVTFTRLCNAVLRVLCICNTNQRGKPQAGDAASINVCLSADFTLENHLQPGWVAGDIDRFPPPELHQAADVQTWSSFTCRRGLEVRTGLSEWRNLWAQGPNKLGRLRASCRNRDKRPQSLVSAALLRGLEHIWYVWGQTVTLRLSSSIVVDDQPWIYFCCYNQSPFLWSASQSKYSSCDCFSVISRDSGESPGGQKPGGEMPGLHFAMGQP